jgi:hypothetical protein
MITAGAAVDRAHQQRRPPPPSRGVFLWPSQACGNFWVVLLAGLPGAFSLRSARPLLRFVHFKLDTRVTYRAIVTEGRAIDPR